MPERNVFSTGNDPDPVSVTVEASGFSALRDARGRRKLTGMRRIAIAAGILIAGASFAADPGVRLYTNADLDRLGPPPAEPSKPIAQPDLPWEQVQGFLDSEYDRVYAERNRLPAVPESSDDRFDRGFRGRLGFAPFGRFGHVRHDQRFGRQDLFRGIERQDRRPGGRNHPGPSRRH